MSTPTGTDSCVTACPFCHPAPGRIVFENPPVIALWDAFPVNRGHALIVPRQNVLTWFDASAE
jgi:diadenosine tetraphosphate (Ap4A) HIT family hydrolase